MTPAQRAYAMYGLYLHEHGWQGIWLPWENLTDLMRNAWIAATAAAIAMILEEHK